LTNRRKIAAILDLDVFVAALKSAEAKNSEVNYEILQKGYLALTYNPYTKDGIFVQRLNIKELPANYYDAYPQTGPYRQTTLKGTLENLRNPEIGWPDLTDRGV
jgi:hypothetical protein